MSKTKCTPGPWLFKEGLWNTPEEENRGHSIGSVIGSGETEWFIARIDNAPEDRANARLIAAAPELLEALKAVSDHGWYEESVSYKRKWLKRAVEAIAKAEGSD